MIDIHLEVTDKQLEYLIGLVSFDLGNAYHMYEKVTGATSRASVERNIADKQNFRAYLITMRIKNEQNSTRIPVNRD